MGERAPIADVQHGEAVAQAGPPAVAPAGPPDVLPPNLPVLEPIELVKPESAGSEVWLYAPSWLASTVVHLLLVLLLALVSTLTSIRQSGPTLQVTVDGNGRPDLQPQLLETALLDAPAELDALDPFEPAPLAEQPPAAIDLGDPVPLLDAGQLASLGAEMATDSLLSGTGGNGLSLRLDGELRKSLLIAGGGTPESEEAVRLALIWLAEHQEYDGSWSFQHSRHPKCNRQCDNPGYTPGKIASTGLALLPFLGTGQTQFQGPHKDNIVRGLKFLVRAIKHQGSNGSLWDPNGTMYGHGLASIALCEAYGMTQDQSLRGPAQSVLNFIVEAQDKNGGGWRYHPGTPGDTSVVGWQLMALKSGQMAYLRVPPVTLHKTGYFLDSVQDMHGATYGYQNPDARRPSTSAIGLLCRMYLGWDHDHRSLARGVDILSRVGPSINNTAMRNNLYYDYYATQVLHHWGGSQWQRWNEVMRDYLVNSQSHKGHETGSWYFDGADQGSGAGGRLYCTAMSAMILEVYYRHMPLYREQSVSP